MVVDTRGRNLLGRYPSIQAAPSIAAGGRAAQRVEGDCNRGHNGFESCESYPGAGGAESVEETLSSGRVELLVHFVQVLRLIRDYKTSCAIVPASP